MCKKENSFSDIETDEGVAPWCEHLKKQIERLILAENILRESSNKRVVKLYPLFMSIIDDLSSIDVLLSISKVNQAYIICRALLERTINFCYLLYADNEEYENFVLYTYNKAGRSLSMKAEVDGDTFFSLDYSGKDSISEFTKSAMDKFTSSKGKEIPRWTKLNIDKRAKYLKEKTGHNLFVHLTMIYPDASEAIHGTLYGALFHFGTFVPHVNVLEWDEVHAHQNSTKSFLFLSAGSAVNMLLASLVSSGEDGLIKTQQAGDACFSSASEASGLASLANSN